MGVNPPPKPVNPEPQAIMGEVVPPDEVETLKRFRLSFFPDARIASQETYAKWLFGLTTTIAALGTGFSNAAFSKLSGVGIFFYSSAVLAAGLGLGLAAWALSEELTGANWASLGQMTNSLTRLMHRKRRILRGATICVFVSFISASAAPLVTTIQLNPASHPSGIVVSISGHDVEPGISLRGLRPGAKAKLEIYRDAAGKVEPVAAFTQITDDSGKISFRASKFTISPEKQNLKIVLTYLRGDDPQREEEDFTISQQMPESRRGSGGGPPTVKKPVTPATLKNHGNRPQSVLALTPQIRAAGLKAGAAKAVITPDVKTSKVYMAGFGNNRVATGVHDDLYVRCVALAAGNENLVMCASDLIGFFYDDVLKVREKVKAAAPEVTAVIVASTHDHEGPDTMGLWGPTFFESGIDENYLNGLDDRIAQTAVRAARSEQPAVLTLARDDHPLLALLQDDGRPPYVKDPYLFVMKLDSAATGQPIATVVNWSDHPETLGGKNTLITADYPHWLSEYVEQHAGGTAVFFNGSIGGLLSTLGDQVALQDSDTGEIARNDTWKKAELFGTTIGELVERALKSGEKAGVDALAVRRAVFFAPISNDHFRVGGAFGVYKGRKPLYTEGRLDPAISEKEFPGFGKLKYATGHDLQTEADYIQFLVGDTPAAEIVTVPGEIYPELINGGIARFPSADFPEAAFEPTVRAHLKTRFQFVFGLANDELGYIIPKAEWDDQPPWLKNRPERWYGEVNSAGPEIAGAVTRHLVELIEHP